MDDFAYRLALDHPDRIDRLAVLDVLPTETVWERADARFVLGFRASGAPAFAGAPCGPATSSRRRRPSGRPKLWAPSSASAER